MLLRPASATWFELLTARDELGRALRILAATGQIELEAHSDVSSVHLLPQLRAAVDEYRRLSQRYAEHWPAPAATPADTERELQDIAAAALEDLRAWAVSAEPLVARLQQLANERSALELLRGLLANAVTTLPNLSLFVATGPVLATRAYLLAPDSKELAIPAAVLTQRIAAGGRDYLLAVGAGESIQGLDEDLSAHKARQFTLPRELPASRAAALAQAVARCQEIMGESHELDSELARLSASHAVGAARADLEFIAWLADHVPELAVSERFAWVTGWTSDPAGGALQRALDGAHVHFLLRFPETPQGLIGPVVLRNPRWVQPFELFARLLGMPAASEADPSLILAVVAPLMFGFMFGDLAQGAVLAAAGVLLRRRYPALALLIPGGIAAMVFGLLFGSVFGREDVLPALWLRPLEQPLTLLRVSLAGGSVIVLIGLALDAVQHAWAGRSRLWWSTRAGLVLCYLGMIAAMFDTRTLWACLIGLLWHGVGTGAQAPANRLKAAGASLGEAAEILLQLFVNTLSFVRIGAFALAHAGLAAAIGGLAAGITSRPLSWLLLLLGNALIIMIEGVVVGIQTTRLVLFEFFIRFLRGSGRPFRPLPGPAVPP